MFLNNEKYSRYAEKFLYASYGRSTLGGTPINKVDDLLSCAIALSHCFSYSTPYSWHFNEKKAEFFGYATFLSYIPYGKAGVEYVQKKLGKTPVWQYQYENAINTLNLDSSYLNDEEKSEFKEYFRLLHQNTYKLDFIGITSIILKCHYLCYVNSCRDASSYISAIFDMYNGDFNKEIDISALLPKHDERAALTGEEMALIDKIFKFQQKTKAHIIPLTKNDFSSVAGKRMFSIKGNGVECVGDIIHFIYEPCYIRAQITNIFNEILSFELIDKCVHHNIGPYVVEIEGAELENISQGDNVLFVITDKALYSSLYAYDKFIVKGKNGVSMLFAAGYPTYKHMQNHNETISYISSKNLPLLNSADEIEALTDNDYNLGVLIIAARCDKVL